MSAAAKLTTQTDLQAGGALRPSFTKTTDSGNTHEGRVQFPKRGSGSSWRERIKKPKATEVLFISA